MVKWRGITGPVSQLSSKLLNLFRLQFVSGNCLELAQGQAVDGKKNNIALCKIIIRWTNLCLSTFRKCGRSYVAISVSRVGQMILSPKDLFTELVQECDSVDDCVNQVRTTAL